MYDILAVRNFEIYFQLVTKHYDETKGLLYFFCVGKA